eukprot:CAMPEP_0206554880 /NCGR_PEP_ID=MMETSP0325_2-20121206/17447_1 /ASSEMBLY_ACC=CAM_ASM_000347 /TAXON_ID=2866 /ORGANISM="Crypthecodinium cohnii, Strain Seligo" /LENGTH=368 /DNA_ID=CAMNT_0054055045 /DNA_START=94 /DNA_END=1200 /DNA_ORIENTATION=+
MVGTAGKQLVSHSGRAETLRAARLFKYSGLFITTVIGPVLDLAAYSFAPQGIIAPLVGLDIVWNTFTAPFTLGEHLTRRHILGSGMVFVGAASSSVFGPHDEEEASLERMQQIFLSWRFVAYILTFGSLLIVSLTTIASSPCNGNKARGVALGATAGGIAGNMFFVSAGGSLIRHTVSTGDYSAWASWLPYTVVCCAIMVAVSNIPFMTKGLQEYEALFMVTLFEGSHIVVACISGAWVLDELSKTVVERVIYWFCVLMIVFGLIIIQTTSNRRRPVDGAESDLESQNGNHLYPDMVKAPSDGEVSSVASAFSLNRVPSGGGITVWASSISGVRAVHFVDDDEAAAEYKALPEENLDGPVQVAGHPKR